VRESGIKNTPHSPPHPPLYPLSHTPRAALQVNEGLADTPSEQLDYSLRQEVEQVVAAGKRIAGAMVRFFEHAGRASGGW
jgi:ATP-dependent DNA helicase HFM1/MER3